MRRYWSSTTARSAAVFPEGRLRVAGRGGLTALPTVPSCPSCLAPHLSAPRRAAGGEEWPAERLTADGEGFSAGQRTPARFPAQGRHGPVRVPQAMQARTGSRLGPVGLTSPHGSRLMTDAPRQAAATMPRTAQRTPCRSAMPLGRAWQALSAPSCALRSIPDTLRPLSVRSSSALPPSGRPRAVPGADHVLPEHPARAVSLPPPCGQRM